MKIDKKKLEKSAKLLLEAIGEDINREGLLETPKRYAKYMTEIFEGCLYTNAEIAKMFDKQFEVGSDDLVIMNDMTVFSTCEHHLALIYNGEITIAYLPNKGKVLGLSKFARIVELVCKRPQIQEKIMLDISEIFTLLGIEDHMIVMDKAKHACMTTRGVKNYTSSTRTQRTQGKFRKDPKLEDKVLNSVKK